MTHGCLPLPLCGRIIGVAELLLFTLVRKNSILFPCNHRFCLCKMSKNLSTIVSENLEKDSFQAWMFRMTKFLMGKGVCPFINGDAQEPILGAAPTIKLKTFKEWHEKAKKLMYWLFVSTLDSMIVHIQDLEMPRTHGEVEEEEKTTFDCLW